MSSTTLPEQKSNLDSKSMSLNQLLGEVSKTLKRHMPTAYWVKADLLDAQDKGSYFLLQFGGEGGVRARGNIWRSALGVVRRFESETGEKLSGGQEILFQCRVKFDAKFGFSLDVLDLDASFTIGKMKQKVNRIRARLKELGEFDLNKKQVGPREFCRVAVIAPENAAGLGDFNTKANVLKQHEICEFRYFYAAFQGPDSVRSIVSAFTQIMGHHEKEKFDVIVMIRGGGDKAGLYELNEAKIARCICRSKVPVFVGIGHDTDNTILDEVAHTRFATPSMVIGAIVDVIQSNVKHATKDVSNLVLATEKILTSGQLDLRENYNVLREIASEKVHCSERSIRELDTRVGGNASKIVDSSEHHLSTLFSELRQAAEVRSIGALNEVANYKRSIEEQPAKQLERAHELVGKHYVTLYKDAETKILQEQQKASDGFNTLKSNAEQKTSELRAHVSDAYRSLHLDANRHITECTYSTRSELDKIKSNALNSVSSSEQMTANYKKSISQSTTAAISISSERVAFFSQEIGSNVNHMVQSEFNQLKAQFETMSRSALFGIELAEREAKSLIENLLIQHPRNVMAKGYSLVRDRNNQVIRSKEQLKPGDEITVEFSEGKILTEVKENE